MKKSLLMVILAMLATVLPMAAQKKCSIYDLPVAARVMLNDNYSGVPIKSIKVDNDKYGKEYDVVLANGVKIEFNNDGVWEEIDAKTSAVPASCVPAGVKKYVASNYNGIDIVKIERDSRKIEVDLASGVELEFDLAGNFLKVD